MLTGACLSLAIEMHGRGGSVERYLPVVGLDPKERCTVSVRELGRRIVLGVDATSPRSHIIRRILRPARLQLFLMKARAPSDRFAHSRGKPINRRYIEEFLATNRDRIRGKCLEVNDTRYIDQFGGEQVDVADVLDIDVSNPQATVVGDLQDLTAVTSNTYDCAIVTSVFQFLEDPAAGAGELFRVLAPGGTALVTAPALGPADFKDADRWRFFPLCFETIFGEHFGSEDVSVTSYGNMLTCLAYLAGLAQEDLPRRAWGFHDPVYPLVVAVRATKPLA